MGRMPLTRSSVNAVYGINTTDTTAAGRAVPSATAHTKGAWAELISATEYYSDGFFLFVAWDRDVTPRDTMLDIAIGASGSELAIIENLHFRLAQSISNIRFIPMPLPAGERISARCQVNTTSQDETGVIIMPVYPNFHNRAPVFGRALTYGANTTTTNGIAYDPGNNRNIKGPYTEITASCTNAVKGILISTGNQSNVAAENTSWAIDIAVGAAGSEVVVIPDAYVLGASNEGMEPIGRVYPVDIPQGSRISFRAQCTINNATDRLIDVSIICFD